MIAHIKAVLTDPGTIPLPQSRVDFSDIHSSDSGKQCILFDVCGKVKLVLF